MAAPMTAPAGTLDFLAAHGWKNAEIRPLAGDASFRRYFRVGNATSATGVACGMTAVLMEAPPPHENPKIFTEMAETLLARGVAAPRVLAADLKQGLVLLEDFGDDRLAQYADANRYEEVPLYETAIDILAHLQREPPPPGLALHDLDFLLAGVRVFAEWYGPMAGLDFDRAGFEAVWAETLAEVAAPAQRVLTLRDYHAENLMVLAGRSGLHRLGLLDFQDARAGHPAYDLVSLTGDARRDVPHPLRARLFERFAAATGHHPERLAADAAALGAQRNTRILGYFARLSKRDGKSQYLALMPRVWANLESDLAHPGLGPLRRWFEANVPAAYRGQAAGA